MTDVRLTATNPVDSSVVPVACNEKGELKLEEPLINSDEFVAKTGDTMTGNLHLGDGITLNPDGSAQFAGGNLDVYDTGKTILGDKITLDVDGSATFAGNVQSQGYDTSDSNASGYQLSTNGALTLQRSSGTSSVFRGFQETTKTVDILGNGSATFAGDVQSGNDPQQGRYSGVKLRELGLVQAARPGAEGIWSGFQTQNDGSTSSATSLINADGSATFLGTVGIGRDSSASAALSTLSTNSNPIGLATYKKDGDGTNGKGLQIAYGTSVNASIDWDGSATFVNDVIVGSRGQQWMIVESNGLAHLVAQSRSNEISTADLVNPDSNEISTADLVDPAPSIEYPPLRDIPGELTMVEEQLQKVLEKLRMVPEAGWEVWDGSD